MGFSKTEREALLTVKGVGEKVIERLEQIGIDSLACLSQANTEDVVYQVAALLNTSCWKNSPQAKASINRAIEFAVGYSNNSSDCLK